jgi:hypothetical protein
VAIEEPLKEILDVYCNVNSVEMVDLLPKNIGKYDVAVVREQLSDAILNSSITPEEYEAITDDCYDTQEELTEWLLELWEKIFGEPFSN